MTETTLEPQPVPLPRDAADVWCVAGTRVPLERGLDSYKASRTADRNGHRLLSGACPVFSAYQVSGK